ncbi:glycosyltransferase [bacterium]|nr:glycosyltransferase [bacterium]
MKVIHVFNSGGLSGPEMLVLPALPHASWLHEIWCLNENRLGESASAAEAFCLQLRLPHRVFRVDSRLDGSAIMAMRRALKDQSERILLHSHDVKASFYLWLACLGLSRRQLQSVVTHHGAMARPDVLSRLYEKLFVTMVRHGAAAKILCVSESEYALLRARGIPQSKLELHVNGIDRPKLTWEQRRAGENTSIKRFVMIARLSEEKNHRRGFHILQKFTELYGNHWTLDLWGEGNQRENLVQMSHQLGLEKNIYFRGFKKDAWKILDHYDCLLSFSLGEGLPISLLEAGWRCTPVFASRVGGIPELCGEQGAHLFPLDESNEQIAHELHSFVSQQSRAKASAEFLQERVKEKFSQSSWLRRLNDIYSSVWGATL